MLLLQIHVQLNYNPDHQAFALESFNRREEGFGLNLPRARLIAEAHGWHLRAESDGEGKGTRMIVEARQVSPGSETRTS